MKKKYEVLGVVGEGAYGIVYKCKNKETGKYVAIKKFKETEDDLVKKTMKRELKMLQQLKHENIVDFQESFIHKGNLFLVFEYVEKNLLEVLEESPDGLPPKLIKSFVYQMCKALAYMHKNNMIHRDIKPENLLIDENLNLKLCDFGFARKVKLNQKNNNINEMTDYVATRWYRSPELLLSGGIYGPDVDYWAVGCIMGELADGNPMFPGENETDQINCIIKVLGNLPDELVTMFYKNPIYEGKKLLEVSKPESLDRKYMGKLGPTAIDFMKGLLQLDPRKRLNSETVFKHKYFSCFMKEEQNNEKKKEKEINDNINKLVSENIKKDKNINKEIINKENVNKEIINKENVNKENIQKDNSNQIKEKKKKENFIIAKNSDKSIENNIIKIDNKKDNNNIPMNNQIETKVINNTTNINIINYNNGIITNTKNIIEIHNNNIQDNISSNNSISKSLNTKDSKNTSNNNTNRNILVNNNMIIKVTTNNNNNIKKQKIKKIEINDKQNNNNNYSNSLGDSMIQFKNNINMNNSIYNNQIGNKKSSSQDKNINIMNYKNIGLFNDYPNLMAISLSQEKINKIKKNSNKNVSNTIDNISSTFYPFKNNKIKNIIPKNITKYNNSLNKNFTEKDLINMNNKSNISSSLLSNNYLNGYKTFFNKDKVNDKYNYNINTKYFKDEMKKYNNSPSPDKYYNNIIDENDEYIDNNNSGINIQSFYIKNNNDNNSYPKKKNNYENKLESKVIAKYKNNIYSNKNNDGLKYNYYNNKKNNLGYGTLYNFGKFGKKKKNVELPQLIKLYNNKNDFTRNFNNNLYNGYSFKNKYYK